MRLRRFRFSIGLRGVAARDVLKNHFRMFNFIQTPIVNGCTLLAIEPLSQGGRALHQRIITDGNRTESWHPSLTWRVRLQPEALAPVLRVRGGRFFSYESPPVMC